MPLLSNEGLSQWDSAQAPSPFERPWDIAGSEENYRGSATKHRASA